MNRSIWSVVVIIFTLLSCKPESNKKTDISNLNWFNAEYENSLNFFKSEFINHFPSKVRSLPAKLYLDTNASPDHIRLTLEITIDSNMDSIVEYVTVLSKGIYNSSDSCLLIVNKFTNNENYYSNQKGFSKNQYLTLCDENLLPIPNFWNYKNISEKSLCKLPDGFKIYVLDSRQGKQWNEKYITSGEQMPIEWKNGFSKGLAINMETKSVIYWFIIW